MQLHQAEARADHDHCSEQGFINTIRLAKGRCATPQPPGRQASSMAQILLQQGLQHGPHSRPSNMARVSSGRPSRLSRKSPSSMSVRTCMRGGRWSQLKVGCSLQDERSQPPFVGHTKGRTGHQGTAKSDHRSSEWGHQAIATPGCDVVTMRAGG